MRRSQRQPSGTPIIGLDKDLITGGRGKEDSPRRLRDLDVMPSMRAMWTAGEALDRDNAAGFNCCYTAVDHIRAFDEAFYLLMCGCGVGFSVERQNICQASRGGRGLPRYSATRSSWLQDSKQGWASALRQLIIPAVCPATSPEWNVSLVRPAGARLKTFGGQSFRTAATG